MGWMYFTLKKKDVFVSMIGAVDVTMGTRVVWWDDYEQTWKTDCLRFFQPPRGNHK